MEKIAILGSGMAGFGATHQLYSEGVESILYEKQPYYGGHTASIKYEEGFIFDVGPHISFTKDERIQKLFAESANHEYKTIKANVNNHWKGHWIKHPAQCNLYGLPVDLLVKILRDFIHAQNNHQKDFQNYEEWLRANYGDTFAEKFPMQYGLKYHTTHALNMTTDWISVRMYQPGIEEILRGALSPKTPDVHYITNFRYPTHNGFVSFLRLFAQQADLRLNHELISIDPKARKLRFTNGEVASYDFVISSIPLPVVIPMISGVPTDVVEASNRLACTSAVVVNVGINRSDIIDAHWTYFYDKDIFFTRLSTPHLQSPNKAPSGCGSLQAECYYSKKYRPLDREPDDCIEPVLRDLKRCGLLRGEDQILFCNTMFLPYANIIFDNDRAKALAKVHAYLDYIGIFVCGRYGEWDHLWTDQSFISGEKAAQRVLEKCAHNRFKLKKN